MNNKDQDFDEIEINNRKGKMTQNLNSGASEQMLEKISDEELKDLVEKKIKLDQKAERLKFALLEYKNAELEYKNIDLEYKLVAWVLKAKYTLQDKDQVNLETGVITRS